MCVHTFRWGIIRFSSQEFLGGDWRALVLMVLRLGNVSPRQLPCGCCSHPILLYGPSRVWRDLSSAVPGAPSLMGRVVWGTHVLRITRERSLVACCSRIGPGPCSGSSHCCGAGSVPARIFWPWPKKKESTGNRV